MCELLIAKGAPLELKDKNGNTPLMLAVKNGDMGRVKYFLSKGADPLAKPDAESKALAAMFEYPETPPLFHARTR